MHTSTAPTQPPEPAPSARLISVVRTAVMRGSGIFGTVAATEHSDGRGRLTLRLAGITAAERYVVRLLSRVSDAAEHGLEIADVTLLGRGTRCPCQLRGRAERRADAKLVWRSWPERGVTGYS